MHPQDVEQLERFIDIYGLEAIREAVVEICHAKAEHIRTNWQDLATAEAWTINAKRLAVLNLLSETSP